MARKSRKNLNPQSTMQVERYKTAFYVRLSVENNNRDDNDTIENQEALLRRYVADKPEFDVVSVFRDNGETGVNFKRPQFELMIDEIKAKKVNCIIVKDLSRFGRNYIEAGEYLESIFPFMNVRFIAVNDNYDSFSSTADELTMHLLNLTNHVYAKDISAKIAPVLLAKQQRGEFIGAWAAYGYLKSQENKHKIIIDQETAPIVQKIFELKAEGASYAKIIAYLHDNNILSPSQYRLEKGIVKSKRFENVAWHPSVLKQMLTNAVYLGHMVQGRKKESLFHGQKQKMLPKEEWIVVKDTHEPLISQDIFDKVQDVMNSRTQAYNEKLGKYPDPANPENIFKSIIYCGDCGRLLTKYKNAKMRKHGGYDIWYNYICPKHAVNTKICSFTSIPEKTLTQTVLAVIKRHIDIALDMEKLIKNKKRINKFESEPEKIARQIQAVTTEITKTASLRAGLYDDYLDKILSEDDYVFANERYKVKESELRATLEELKSKKTKAESDKPTENVWLKSTLAVKDCETLSRELLLALVRAIIVYDKENIHIEFCFTEDYKRLCEQLSCEVLL